jgi:tetratricopeptide (TPR) repeat protein
MNKKIQLVVKSAVILPILLILIWFFSTNISLRSKLTQSKQLNVKMQEHVQQVEQQKAQIAQENDKLKEDALSYLNLNNELQLEKETADKKLSKALKIINEKERDLGRNKLKLTSLNKRLVEYQSGERTKFSEEKAEVEKKMKELEASLQKEKGVYHYNLAVAYTQAKLYDEAIIEYKKALEFNPDNAEAYYNLGLIYSKAIFNPEKAAFNYTNYLKLKPDAYDAEEVEAWIDDLQK